MDTGPGPRPFLAAFTLLLVSWSSAGAENRLYLASQHDWGKKLGFYLDFECKARGESPCRLADVSLILGVADGASWRFLSERTPWEFDTDYRARGVVEPGRATLYLDGKLLGESTGRFAPVVGPGGGTLTASDVPGWASAKAEYIIVQRSLEVSAVGGRRAAFTFAEAASRQVALMMFEKGARKRLDWSFDVLNDPEALDGVTPPGETLTIEATFRFIRPRDPRDLAPFIDRYGQSIHADFPGKVKSDDDLKRAAADEERRLAGTGRPRGYDRFGGCEAAPWRSQVHDVVPTTWREEATGFYRLAKRSGFWWLVSPEGNPCFYLGVCTAPAETWPQTPVTGREYLFEWLPPKDGPYSAAWGRGPWGVHRDTEYVAFHTANMIRKYGDDWKERARELTGRRIRAWAFSGIGKWGGLEGFPSLPVLWPGGVPNVARHMDCFDPAARDKFRESMRKLIEPRLKDPFVVGWSVRNEYEEIVTKGEVKDILGESAGVPAKRALVDHAVDDFYGGDAVAAARAWKVAARTREELHAAKPNPPDEDVEKLRRFYADRYYAFIYRTVKELDPNHLYFGFWIVPGWWVNEEDWRLIAPHCDAIGYDRYSFEFADERLARLVDESDKPILCGEFSFPPWYRGQKGYGFYPSSVDDEEATAEWYGKWLRAAAAHPHCVGTIWFQYRDQPLTGRGPGTGPGLVHGEHFAFGLVDITDRPKWGLVDHMRRVNLDAVRWRLEAMGE